MDNKQKPNFNSNQSYPQFNPQNQSLHSFLSTPSVDTSSLSTNLTMEWDPQTMLTNLSFLEQKLQQVQEMVRKIIQTRENQQFSLSPNELSAQHQLLTTDLTCIIIQLVSTAGSLLPSVKNSILSGNPPISQFATLIGPPSNPDPIPDPGSLQPQNPSTDYDDLVKNWGASSDPIHIEDQDVKESEDLVLEGENLPPGSYEVLQLEKDEILAPHTHFCTICGKGFKRDANLRMHMRGHGDEYKTPAALAKPVRDPSLEHVPVKRYSCPFIGCKRNKEHKNFQPLKTILCVKNHYKRSHCEKSYTCSRCNTKKFSVLADLKTHEKHCGRDKWICSCGTTFSRKDKLFGHVALFQGHTPALPSEEMKVGNKSNGEMERNGGGSASSGSGNNLLGYGDEFIDIKNGYFSPMNFDSFGFGALDDFSFVGDFARKNQDN